MENVLINEKYLKKYSPIPLNFSMSEVNNYVKITEEIWVKPILGDLLYDELLEQVKNNTVSDENATLLLQIYPYESYATILEGLPFLFAHISEVGITKGSSDNSDSVDLKDINYIETHLRKQVEVRKDNLIKWLKEYGDNYPLYTSSDCDCEEACSCQDNGKLNNPNPYLQIYCPRKIKTKIE